MSIFTIYLWGCVASVSMTLIRIKDKKWISDMENALSKGVDIGIDPNISLLIALTIKSAMSWFGVAIGLGKLIQDRNGK